jgi:hypothetical protein
MSPLELEAWMEKTLQQPRGSWYYRNIGKFMMEETFQDHVEVQYYTQHTLIHCTHYTLYSLYTMWRCAINRLY